MLRQRATPHARYVVDIREVEIINNMVVLRYDQGSILEYQKKMLLAMEDGIFLPMSFLETEEYEEVTHDVSGFVSMDGERKILRSVENFRIIDNLFKNLIHLEEYLIYPKDYELSKSTVFVNQNQEVRLQFRPAKARNTYQNISINQSLEAFINELLTEELQAGLEEYLVGLISFIKGNPKGTEVMCYISKILRELSC